jgi:hypothetical protein
MDLSSLSLSALRDLLARLEIAERAADALLTHTDTLGVDAPLPYNAWRHTYDLEMLVRREIDQREGISSLLAVAPAAR